MVSPPPPPRPRSRLPPADPRLAHSIRDPQIRANAASLIQHALDAFADLQRLDESLYERFMEGGGRVADDAAPDALLRRLSTITFRGLRALLAFAVRIRPKDPTSEAPPGIEEDFDFGGSSSEVEDGFASSTVEAAEPSFALADSEIEDVLDIFDEQEQRDEGTLWSEVLGKTSAIEYGLRSQLRELEARLEVSLETRQIAQALEALDDTRSSVSEGIFALLSAVYQAFLPDVDPATVAPGHLTSLQRALLVRRGLTDLGRAVGPKNDVVQSASSSPEKKAKALDGVRAALGSFVGSDVFRAMRPADRWEITKFHRELSAGGPGAGLVSEGLAKYLESLGSVNRREVLVLHDERALDDLRETLAAARPLLEYNTRVAGEMVRKALALADSLYGRSPSNDELIVALREASPSLEAASEIEGTLAMLELLIAEEPT